MIRTRLTELMGIDYPVVQGGMIWMSGYKLATAVSNSGGLGLIGASSMSSELLREHIQKGKAATDKPFGVNIPIFNPMSEDYIKITLDEGIKVIFLSAGSPAKYLPAIKDAGAIAFQVVSTPRQAVSAENAGVDGIVAEGFEAGGHNGRDELTSMVLLPQVVDLVKVPVLGAGGFATGRHLAAALSLGAEGIQVGSRFAVSIESSGHPAFKDAVVKSTPTDTVLAMKRAIPVRLLKNKLSNRILEAEAGGSTEDELIKLLGSGKSKMGMMDGNLDEGELEIGQVSGMISDIPGVSEIIDSIIKEYYMVLDKLPK